MVVLLDDEDCSLFSILVVLSRDLIPKIWLKKSLISASMFCSGLEVEPFAVFGRLFDLGVFSFNFSSESPVSFV